MSGTTPPKSTPRIGACSMPITLPANSRTGKMQIFPAGEFRATHAALVGGAGPWRVTDRSRQRIAADWAAQSNPALVDYEHQSLLAQTNGKPVPAAGWIPRDGLRFTADGVFARVEWTEAAAAAIRADEYRYASPVFEYDPASGEVLSLINVALTNSPAVDGMAPAIAAASMHHFSTPEPCPMNDELIDRLRHFLNLPTAATTADITAELGRVVSLISAQQTQSAFAATTTHPVELIQAGLNRVAALAAQVPEPGSMVPISQIAALRNEIAVRDTELAALRAEKASRELAELIEPALADGRLLPAQKEWAEELGATSLDLLRQHLASVQPLAALTRTQTGGAKPAPVAALSDPVAIAAAATAYQTAQAALGLQVDDVAAVLHVTTHGAR